MPAVTREDAIVQAAAAMPWLDPGDIEGLIDGSAEEQALIIASYKTAGVAPSADAWAVFLAILETCATIAGAVTGIGGAVATVYGLGKL